jgi:hypothetical protein
MPWNDGSNFDKDPWMIDHAERGRIRDGRRRERHLQGLDGRQHRRAFLIGLKGAPAVSRPPARLR